MKTILQENLFKIKKIVIETGDRKIIETIGFITPEYKQWEPGTLSANEYKVVSIYSSDYLKLHDLYPREITFKTTRITDEKLKKALNQLIAKEKERYKMACQIAKLQQKAKEIREETSGLVKALPNVSGLLNKEEFFELINDFRTVCSHSGFYPRKTVVNGKLTNLELEKKVKVIDEDGFSFLYTEYDGNLLLYGDYETFEEYQALSKKHFTPLKPTKIEGWEIQQSFKVDNISRRSIDLVHTIELIPKKELPLVKESATIVASVLDQIFKAL